MVLKIVQDEVKKNPNTPPVVIYMLLRQCRVPMQVTEVCGKKTNVVRFEYDPDNQTADQIEKDAEFLLKKSMEMVYNTPSARYDLYMKALNVFENKLLRLHEAAFNENFFESRRARLIIKAWLRGLLPTYRHKYGLRSQARLNMVLSAIAAEEDMEMARN